MLIVFSGVVTAVNLFALLDMEGGGAINEYGWQLGWSLIGIPGTVVAVF